MLLIKQKHSKQNVISIDTSKAQFCFRTDSIVTQRERAVCVSSSPDKSELEAFFLSILFALGGRWCWSMGILVSAQIQIKLGRCVFRHISTLAFSLSYKPCPQFSILKSPNPQTEAVTIIHWATTIWDIGQSYMIKQKVEGYQQPKTFWIGSKQVSMSVEMVFLYFLGGDSIPYFGLVPIKPRSSCFYKHLMMKRVNPDIS